MMLGADEGTSFGLCHACLRAALRSASARKPAVKITPPGRFLHAASSPYRMATKKATPLGIAFLVMRMKGLLSGFATLACALRCAAQQPESRPLKSPHRGDFFTRLQVPSISKPKQKAPIKGCQLLWCG